MDTSSMGANGEGLTEVLQYSLPPTTVELDFLQQCHHRQSSGGTVHVSHFYAADICSNMRTAVDDLCDKQRRSVESGHGQLLARGSRNWAPQ